MSTQEFYIRGDQDPEARGPFNIDQLSSLAEAGQVNGDTLYYDAGIEQWVTVGSNPELMATLFPEKKRLRIKEKVEVKTINVQRETDKPITVEEMLAAAEGKTRETKGRGDPKVTFERVAGWGCRILTVVVAANMVALLYPHLEPIYALDWAKLLPNPFILFGAFDLFLTIMLLLGATSIYPVLRFRALLGLGFFGLFFFLTGRPDMVVPLTAGALGTYFATAAVSWGVLLPSAVLALLGTGVYTYLLLG